VSRIKKQKRKKKKKKKKTVVEEPAEDPDEEEGAEFEKSDSPFDDMVPDGLPIGASAPELYDGNDDGLSWKFMRRMPSGWPGDIERCGRNPLNHATPYLDAIHLPLAHRAHIWLQDLDTLRLDHHIVYWHAAHNYYMEHGIDEVDIPMSILAKLSPKDKLWECAMKEDHVSLDYFGRRREQLMSDGYCIMENFLKDEDLPTTCRGLNTTGIEGSLLETYNKLREDVKESVPALDSLGVDESTHWNYIINRGDEDDRDYHSVGAGRYTTRRVAVMEGVEQDASRVWNSKARAFLDLRVAHCMGALKVCDQRSSEKMYVPSTGGRWLFTSKGCKRQQLHTDFAYTSDRLEYDGTRNPGFFAMCTSSEEVPVCIHSHRLVVVTRYEDLRKLGEVVGVSLVRIPPFSIFFGRGDTFHAGAGFGDSPTQDGLIRYHLYFVPVGVDLPDGVHLFPTFNPKFMDSGEVMPTGLYNLSGSD